MVVTHEGIRNLKGVAVAVLPAAEVLAAAAEPERKAALLDCP
jgi:hypothetical protein